MVVSDEQVWAVQEEQQGGGQLSNKRSNQYIAFVCLDQNHCFVVGQRAQRKSDIGPELDKKCKL